MSRNMGGNMLYKNVILVITLFLTLIMAALISTSYYGYNAKDYSGLKEYVGSDTIDIAKDVKIENIDYLYFDGEGSEYTKNGWMYKTIYIESLIKDENRPSRIAEFVITYKGQRLNFNYEISVADGVILTGDELAKFRITSKDKNIQGTLEFELPTREVLRSFYVKKSLAMIISIALGADLIICIIFAFVDYKKEKGFFSFYFDLPDFCKAKQKPFSPEQIEEAERAERERKQAEDEKICLEQERERQERINFYENKYDLKKSENMAFKELAYDTIFKLFPDENDYKKSEIPSESKNIYEK